MSDLGFGVSLSSSRARLPESERRRRSVANRLVRRSDARVLVGTTRRGRAQVRGVVRHPFAWVAGETSGAIHVAMRRWGETSGTLTPSMVKSNGPSLIL